ncbi:MAG: hypothetical protein ACNA8W_15315 [Bradymonadaceae bacterium]
MKAAVYTKVFGPWCKPLAWIGLVFLAVVMTGCAYKYAGQEGRNYPDERTAPPPPTQVVSVTGVDEDGDRKAGSSDAEKPDVEEPQVVACDVPTFDVYFFDATTQIIKTIDCTNRRVVNVNRGPIGRSYYQEAREANLPEETWYALVDPKGERARYLSNPQMKSLGDHFSFRLLGRDLKNDLLVYEYLDDEL